MDDIDRAQHQEEMAREICLRAARNAASRDYEAEVCNGCQFANQTNYGKSCEAWRECLEDLQKRERRK